MARGIVPAARFLMIEGQEEMRSSPDDVSALDPAIQDSRIALLGDRRRDGVPFEVMETGSSIYPQMTLATRASVERPMMTLDGVVADSVFTRSDRIKLDVRGAELAILEGSPNVLGVAEVAFQKASILPYNQSAPGFGTVVGFLDEHGFTLLDIAKTMRDPNDVLSQCDLIFIRRESGIRLRRIDAQQSRFAPESAG